MMQRLLMTRRNMLFSLVGMLMTAMLTLWGCGGGGGTSSYTDPSPTTVKSASIIDATTLKQWINEGKLNAPFGSKDRVVVVSPSTTADWTGKGHIPGAVRLDTTEVAKSRVEGLAIATNMIPDGAMMDLLVQRLGIDGNTTIVFSLPKNGTIYYQSLAFWNFRYWGFARDRIKILNGGDDAWDVAGFALSTDAGDKYAASTYSVNQNAGLKDAVRGSLSETISFVDALILNPTLKNTQQIIDVRGATVSPYLTNALRMVQQPGHTAAYTMYLSRLNGDSTKNFVYPDKATFETRLATLSVKDGTADVFASAAKKTLIMCASSFSASPGFVLFDAVLNAAEGDIVMYDGSSSQWTNYNTVRLTGPSAYPTATATQISAWSFDNATNPRAQGSFTTPTNLTTDVQIWSVFSPVFAPSDPSMNQIEAADKLYMTPAATTTTGTTSSGGSTPSGC